MTAKQRYQAAHLASGLCIYCPRPARRSKLCEECQTGNDARKLAYRKRHLENGLCVNCPNKRTLYARECNKCRVKQRARTARLRGHKLRGEGGQFGPLPRGELLMETR